MKLVALLSSVFYLFSANATLTVDSNTNVFFPVKHIQSGEYFVQMAPLIGCYGLPRGPQLQQLTKAYKVNNLGCGTVTSENINALTCATVVGAVESNDYSTFKLITMNIKKCEDKNNSDFIAAVRKSVRLNFATKTVPHPKLVLLK